MWIADHWKDYAVLDYCGGGEKLNDGAIVRSAPDRRLSGRATRTVGLEQTKHKHLSSLEHAGGGSGEIRKLPGSGGLSTTVI